ncbi:MAG: bifunctional [glutamate--ammonia ligase]-adenylyl-L-tyrosine phosphorylase/[glutamate--ammonia-ligase] adenylyltransferase [Reinekea sp.]|jgi:[glutamine synthetase] adenylyltransferase / [glutamine synthetase]-adenylyl-L-tyrosine phosphorylase
MVKVTAVFEKEWSRIQADSRLSVLNDTQQSVFKRIATASTWFMSWLQKQPDWLAVDSFIQQPDVDSEGELNALAEHWVPDGEAHVMRDLRLWRNRHQARLIARDILGLNRVRQTAAAATVMADCAVHHALRWCQAFWEAKDGKPPVCPLSGETQTLVVIAMGKHGAEELNLSSDIDLIFAYSRKGETDSGRPLESFFTRVGRKLIHLLDAQTADGFVFRVDMRLRPWGQSGALVSSFSALQNYYLQQGRFWERFALVKARAVTGHPAVRESLDGILKPFVYRRYVDFQALGALRELKAKIQAEVRRQNLDYNIKLGSGGIREVEFIAQVFQLVRGGKDESLQVRGTWPVLVELAKLHLLPDEAVAELMEGYDFLRDLEHRIQAIGDEQTQNLPVDEVAQARLAASKGVEDWSVLMAQLEQHRTNVHNHFQQLIADPAESGRSENDQRYFSAWQGAELLPDENASGLSVALLEFKTMRTVDRLTGVAEQNLDAFIPLLWQELDRYSDGLQRFGAIRPILEAVLRRTSYFALLTENPEAIQELIRLAPASEWIATELRDKPFLLDELIDRNSLYRLPDRQTLSDELHQTLLRVPEDDLERQMELLRHFRHGRVLRAAACEVTQHLPLMKISDYLAWVAEVVVAQALALAWRQMVSTHGRPSKEDGDWCDSDFGVIAYGKMGGLELSYESDLDLVFLHNASAQGVTEGPKSIENGIFMTRLGQKLIHILSAVTPSGMLYEVDTRLRPSGKSGLLVSSLPAFLKYQQEKAWTWEHQALVRARFIAGDLNVQKMFEEFRARILGQQREPDVLKGEVVEMRQKMLDHLSSSATRADDEVFHIKQDPGGIVDLEFIVQYLILAHAHKYPALLTWSDNVRSIEELHTAGLISTDEKEQWLEAYLSLRQMTHHAILSSTSKRVPLTELTDAVCQARDVVRAGWEKYLTE